MSSPDRFSVISSFSGTGGSSLGYKMAGGRVLLAIEWDDHAVECYRANFRKTPIFHGDISKLTVNECLKRTGLEEGELDIFDGSPPCQGFSMAGKRDFNDNRNQLFKEYVRLLRGLKPKVFVMENVSGLVKGKMKLVFAEIMKELRKSGYRVSCRLMNSKYYGVPQARERLIFIGVRNDLEKEPSHPRPKVNPITAGEAVRGLDLNRIKRFNTDEAISLWNRCRPGDSFSTVHLKGHWFNRIKASPLKPFPTITKTAGIAHWSVPGLISIDMVKRACSFPDDFILTGSFDQQWARMGNAVPPLLMKEVSLHIYENFLQ